jgi:hypothetical protein
MTRQEKMLDAKERLYDAKSMLENYEENQYDNDSPVSQEVLLNLEIDVFFAAKHLSIVERSL